MGFDANSLITFGITAATILLGIGGAWRGVVIGLRNLENQNKESAARIEEKLRELTVGLDKVRDEFLRKDVDAANERAILARIASIEKRLDDESSRRKRGT